MILHWGKHQALAITGAVVLLAGIGAALLQWHARRLEDAHLLLTAADQIIEQPRLYRQALARGRPAFVRYCASCHGVGGGPDHLWGVPDLRDRDWLYGGGRVDEIEKVILYGIRAGNSKGWNLASMPAFATPNPYSLYKMPPLTPQEIADVTEYLFAFQHSGVDATAMARGKQVYRNPTRGLCWDCHAGDGRGDSGIGAPDLTDAIWLYGDGSRRAIQESISRGRHGSCPAWSGKLAPATIVAVAVYVQSLSRSPRPPVTARVSHE